MTRDGVSRLVTPYQRCSSSLCVQILYFYEAMIGANNLFFCARVNIMWAHPLCRSMTQKVTHGHTSKAHEGSHGQTGSLHEQSEQGVGYIQVPGSTRIEETANISDLGLNYDEEVGAELAASAQEISLPDTLREIVQDDGVLGDRALFTWKWIYYICGELLTLPCVADDLRQTAHEAKFLLGVYSTMVDDLAEKHGDKTTFWELSKAFYPEQEPNWDREDIDRNYARSARRVYQALCERLDSAPRRDEFEESFRFDFRASIQAMDFARMSDNLSGFSNRPETWYFETTAIAQFPVVDIDLMYSPEFDIDDYSALRELVYELQHLWRLGNWVVTWRHEVYEHDFSAGIFVEAKERDIVTQEELERIEDGGMSPEEVVERIEQSGIAERFVADWKRRRDELREREFEMESIDPDQLISDMESLMRSHLASENHR